MKKKIVMVVDTPDWAFTISARDMVRYIDKYEFKIVCYDDDLKNETHYKDADLIYLFSHYMLDWIPDINKNKLCAGVRAVYDLRDKYGDIALKKTLNIPFIHTVSKELYNLLKKNHKNVSYVSHGVDTNFFKPNNKKPGEKLIFGWAGNKATKEKNFDLLEGIFENRDDVLLKVASYDKCLSRNEMKEFYKSIDVYILPSRSEGNSATLLEAISCGLPVIATNAGTWPEIYKRTGGGIITDPDWLSINNAIDKIKKSNLHKLGNDNRKEALKYWDWKIKAKEFEKFFDVALNYKPEKNTIDTFSHKWLTMPKGYGDRSDKQIRFFQEWAAKKYGFKHIGELNKFYKGKKKILEVGIGSAFNLNYISQQTDAEITGVDISEVVCNEAKEKFKNNDKIKIVRSDLMNLPFNDNEFDLIIADGVLHHTQSTENALKALYKKVAKTGHLYAYIYKKSGPVREFTNDWIRKEIDQMAEHDKLNYVKRFTNLGERLSRIKERIRIDDLEVLGLKAGDYTVQELFYYGVLKCFWNDCFSYDENNLNNYDWFAPEFAHRHTEEEVLIWLKELSCVSHINNANPNGISLLIEKIE